MAKPASCAPQPGTRLAPCLGLVDAVAIGLGAIIGGGIFIVTGIVAGLAGPALILSIFLATAISLATALSFFALTQWRPAEGSVYVYARTILSPFAGFLSGWMWIAANVFAGAAVALGIAHYLQSVAPGVDPKATAALLCLAFTVLNLAGVKNSARVNNVLVGAKIAVLLLFVLVGAFSFKPAHFTPFVTSASGVFRGAFFIFFAFAGFGRVATIAEEVRDARKTVPRSIILALFLSAIIYIAVSVAALGLVDAGTLAASKSPLADAIRTVGRPALVYVVSLGGMLAMASVLLTSILGVSRMIFAMAREGDLPVLLSRLRPKSRTPWLPVFIAGVGSALLALFFDLTNVVAIGTFATLFNYSLANLSALKLAAERETSSRIVPLAGLLLCFFLLLFVQAGSFLAGMAFLLPGALFYLLRRKRRNP